jgi:ribosomal protein S3
LAGRFTRRDRATFVWKSFGKMNLNTKTSFIDYYVKDVQLPYSRCIAKLWVNNPNPV